MPQEIFERLAEIWRLSIVAPTEAVASRLRLEYNVPEGPKSQLVLWGASSPHAARAPEVGMEVVIGQFRAFVPGVVLFEPKTGYFRKTAGMAQRPPDTTTLCAVKTFLRPKIRQPALQIAAGEHAIPIPIMWNVGDSMPAEERIAWMPHERFRTMLRWFNVWLPPEEAAEK